MTHYSLHGASVPALGFGTYQLTGDAARQGTEHALALGYRHLDTAQIYDNEAEVGAALSASGVPRDNVFLTTKVWRDSLAPADFAASVLASLKRLETDYVDLLLVHWPNDDVPLAETLGALDRARDQGQARLIGVSNFPPGMLRRALEIVPDLANVQVEHHVHLGQPDLLAIVREHGMTLTAYSPLGQGQALADETVREIAEARGVGPAQVALAYLLGQDRVLAIPKAAASAHRESNLAAAEITLTNEERARLDALPKDRRIVDPGFAPDWSDGAS